MPKINFKLGLLMLLVFGCYSPERSLSLDPHNKPIVHILESQYNLDSGTVLIKWEYIGSTKVTAFEVHRRILGDFEVVARIVADGEIQDYAYVATYQDDALIAGENVFYQVVAELASGGKELTQTKNVVIPGAQALETVRDPINLSVQFRWLPDPNVASGYQVMRSVGGGQSVVIYETNSPTESSFVDQAIQSNEPYEYLVRTLTPSGKTLVSRSVTAHFYRLATTQPVETVLTDTERLRLSVGEPTTSGGTLAIVAREKQLSLYQFRYQIGLSFDGSPRILRTLVGIAFPSALAFSPKSVDLAGPLTLPSFSVFPRLYVGGLLGNGQIDIVGFDMPLLNQVWSLPNRWDAPLGATHVALARDDQDRIYAAAGNELRVFSSFGGLLGNETLSGFIKDMSIQGDRIWVALENGRVERGVLVFNQGVLSAVQWETVVLPLGAEIVAMTHNNLGQVFLLDANNRKMIVAQPNGTSIFQFGLPFGDYRNGDVVVDQSSGNLLQVTDGHGDIVSFIP
ncbi:MAG: hypothetical protein ACO36I_12945 [Candidatus Latescibacterota bacterium]